MSLIKLISIKLIGWQRSCELLIDKPISISDSSSAENLPYKYTCDVNGFLDGTHVASGYPSIAESHSSFASLSHVPTIKGTYTMGILNPTFHLTSQ